MSTADPRLKKHPSGWMLANLIRTPGGGPLCTHVARCEACNVEQVIVAGHGDSLRLAFEACNDHNKTHHLEVPEGVLF